MILISYTPGLITFYLLWDMTAKAPAHGSTFMHAEEIEGWMRDHQSVKIRKNLKFLPGWISDCGAGGAGHNSPAVTAKSIMSKSGNSLKSVWEKYGRAESPKKKKRRSIVEDIPKIIKSAEGEGSPLLEKMEPKESTAPDQSPPQDHPSE